MSTGDREALEMAAMAAGLKLFVWGAKGAENFRLKNPDGSPGNNWAPLTDDGDALRLAVRLSISIDVNGMFVHADCRHRKDDIGYFEENSARHDGDMMRATRRVIVRAAAEIGRAMP